MLKINKSVKTGAVISKISEPLICVQTWTAREKERCHNTSAEKKIPTVITHSHHESHKLDKKGQKREL
jgi:hypothetical protein